MDTATVEKIKNMAAILDERQLRLYLAHEAKALGSGYITQLSKIAGTSRMTIYRGLKEIEAPGYTPSKESRCRKKGGGRKSLVAKKPEILSQLENLMEPYTCGDPENPLKWISKSIRNIESALNDLGTKISDTTVLDLLRKQGFTLQTNRKSLAMKPSHPERNNQFLYINNLSKLFMAEKSPVISIDAKKKENIGNFKNNGAEFNKKGEPPKVFDHDFIIKELGKATPYGILDIFHNLGFINIGISSDVATFAVNSIRRWFKIVGQKLYPKNDKLYITADAGGSNGYRVRLWKLELQNLANEFDTEITVSHYPPGASKWNKIEHRLFSFISQNWRGKPLISLAVIVNLIAATTTKGGLKVEVVVDEQQYEKGQVVTDEEIAMLNVVPHGYQGAWNYTVLPEGRKPGKLIKPLLSPLKEGEFPKIIEKDLRLEPKK
jgi:transposase